MIYQNARRDLKAFFTNKNYNRASANKALKCLYNYPHLLGLYLKYDKLIQIHSTWIFDIWTANKTVLLEAHRGSYKTTAVLIVGCIWYLLFNPDNRILIVREEGKNARKILRAIRDKYKTPEMAYLYKKLFDIDIKLIRDTENSMTLSTMERNTPEGNIECIGIDGSLTGGHYEKIHCDDIVTLKDRISRAKRDNAKLFIQELTNIIDPGLSVTYTGTPWHRDDAYSYIAEHGAIVKKYSINDIKIKSFTKDHVLSLRRTMSPALFAANYELKHIADADSLFPDPNYGDWHAKVQPRAHIDAKYRGRDTMALTMMGEYNGNLYAVGRVFHDNIEKMYQDLISIMKSYNCGTLYLETNADKGLAATAFRQRGIPVIDYHESDNKHIKIITYLYREFKKIIWAPETDADYMAQIVDYQEGQEPDDCPDSAASLIREMGINTTGIKTDELLSIGV